MPAFNGVIIEMSVMGSTPDYSQKLTLENILIVKSNIHLYI